MLPTRYLALAVLVMATLACSESDDGDVAITTEEPVVTSNENAVEGELELVLVDGAFVDVAGFSLDGEDAPSVPMSVAFSSMTCTESIPDANIDEFDKVVDATAPSGDQLCLVELSVTNTGDAPGWFSADLVSVGVTSSGGQLPAATADYDPTLLASNLALDYVGDMDGIGPGQTAFDVVVYSVPTQDPLTMLTFDGPA